MSPRTLGSLWAFTAWTLVLMAASTPALAAKPNSSGNTPPDSSLSGSRPNIVLIVVDTLRADALTTTRNGMPLMPELNQFATESWWFSKAISQSSWTRPAMASIFTSMYFSVHNVQCGVATKITEGQDKTVDVLPSSAQTMAHFLKTAGYSTGCIQTNPQIDAPFGFAQGIDNYTYVGPEKRADTVTDLALAALRSLTLPSFLYVHYMDPHGPYAPPKPFDTLFGPPPGLTEEDRRLIDDFTGYYHDKVLYDVGVHSKRAMGDLQEAGREYVRYMYDGEVRFVDNEVARFIRGVRQVFPDTIIVFTSDHGEEFWEHGSVGHGKTLYQELIHVPLIVSIPGERPLKYDQLVETIDILPTLAARLGLPSNQRWQGIDLAKQTRLPDSDRAVFSRTRTSLRESKIDFQAVVRGAHKLVLDEATGRISLFDLNADPFEKNNLADSQPEKSTQLRAVLAEHERTNAQHPQSQVHEQTDLLNPEVFEHLRSIGYIK